MPPMAPGPTAGRRSTHRIGGVPRDLFAGIPVTDLAAGISWYERLFGKPPAFLPNDSEAVWELAENRFVFIELRPEHARHARHLLFIDDIEAYVAQVEDRGLAPVDRESYANGVRKVSYEDPDGNRFEFGAAPD